MLARRSVPLVAAVLTTVVGCADDAAVSSPSAPTTSEQSATTSTTVAATTVAPTTTTELPDITVPTGVLAAIPFQNRLDVPAGIFQTKLINGSPDAFTVTSLQFVWDGFTSDVVERRAEIVPGERIDLPLPFPGAQCVGDGSATSMPDPSDAVVRLHLEDGTDKIVPVFDRDHVARTMYLDDCERQHIADEVSIEWTELHEGTDEGRPMTFGRLQVTRRASTSNVTLTELGSTIVFDPEPIEPGATGEPLAVLDRGETSVGVDVRFLESRCDPHALSEASQAFLFVVRVDLGDGVVHPYVVIPHASVQGAMRATLTAGCDELGKIRPFDPDSGHATSTTAP